jgi:glycosyltransferase involved in cell wall biosynthesis
MTRQRGLDTVETEWVAFLDDDDEFLPEHLELLMNAALEQDADYVYSWYHVIGGTDPRPEVFGRPWDPENPVQTTITTLVRTTTAQAAGFLVDPEETDDLTSPDRHYAGEDWRFTQRVNDAGAHIYHLPMKTWNWYHHSGNTSGLPNRW